MRKTIVLIIVNVFICSCTALHPEARKFYRQGYQAGMEHALETFNKNIEHAMPVYTWQPPVVERVWIPGRLVGNFFVPGHEEWVLVKPGQWEIRTGPATLRDHAVPEK